MSRALSLAKWLAPLAALSALACALLAPAEAGAARRQRRTPPANVRVPADGKPSPPAVSAVRGRVVYDDTTRPVRRARVTLVNGDGGRTEHVALTDSRGEFRIEGVPAGSYYASVDTPGVLSPFGFFSGERPRDASGMPDPGAGREFFDVIEVDGKQDLTVTVHARRGGAVSGRVSYADGDPAANVYITLMRRSADGRFEKFMPAASVAALTGQRADDRGQFRITGLPPGEYLVGVTELIHHGGEGAGAVDAGEDIYTAFRTMFTEHLLMTFHPSATSAKEAAVVKVGAGEERADIDISIPDRDLRTVSGVVRARRGGAPVAGARVAIAPRGGDSQAPTGPVAAYMESLEPGMNAATTDEQGRWRLVEIPDGDYVISVKPPKGDADAGAPAAFARSTPPPDEGEDEPPLNVNAAAPRPARPKRFYAPTSVKLDVSGGDVSEFVVEVAEGARIAGTVSVEGGGTPAYSHVSVLRLGEGGVPLEQAESESAGAQGGRFSVEGLAAGRFLIQPTLVGGEDEEEEEGVYLKSITWNGKDLLRAPLELAEGAEASGVRIIYGRNPATLRVSVRGAAARRPAEEFLVTLVPAELGAWSAHAQSFFCETEGGACDIPAPPGDYRVLAMRATTDPEDYEREVRRRAPNAARATLREGETSRVEVDAPGN